MPKRNPNTPRPLPSKDEVAAYIARATGKVGKREIARAFGIGGGDRIWLKQMLGDLEAEGAVNRRRKALHKADRLPPVLLADITGRDRDGELVAAPAEWDADGGAAPRIVVTVPAKGRPGQPVPGVGDRALLRLTPHGHDEHVRYSGRVIKIIAKHKAQVLGIFRALPAGGGRLVPVDKKSQGRELVVAAGDEGEAEDGDLVAATVAKHGRYGLAHATVRERLGSLKSEKAVSLVAIHAHAIPHVFPESALAEAERAEPATPAGREDWRALPLVTIDPPDAKDHDDAVHAVADDDPANPGGHVVTVAIADVAAYVRPGSALDREAVERGNSVYFPDRVVPMLPERISNDLCSLRAAGASPGARGAHDHRRRRAQAAPHVPSRAHALGREALLRAGARRHRRPTRRHHGPAAGAGAETALGRLCLREAGARYARTARPRPAGAQDPPERGRHGRPRARARAPRRAPAHRGVHDPRQRGGGRDPGAGRLAARLSGA